MRIKWFGYIPNSFVNGKGVRDTIFLSGCKHNCDGCHNKEGQSINYGQEIDIDEIVEILAINNDMVDGITLSGGDPLYQYEKTLELCRRIKESEMKNKNIWIYTGYTIEQIKERFVDILDYCDVIVDGKYEKDLPKAEYRGSENQRIIIVNK